MLLDAMGTLVHLEAPVERLHAALRERTGLDVDRAAAAAALEAEIACYRDGMHTAVDPASLGALRGQCAEAMRPALGLTPGGAPSAAVLTAALLDAIVVRAYPEVPGVLRALRAAGWTIVVVSNWDVSLDERLAQAGLIDLVDATVTSVAVGEPKPARAMFTRGLTLAGVRAQAAWHVGDDLEADVAGALGAGIRPVLVDRDGGQAAPAGVAVVGDLDALPELVGAPNSYA